MGQSRTHIPEKIPETERDLWLSFAGFLANTSFLIPDTIAFDRLLPYFTAAGGSQYFNVQEVEMVGYEAYFVEQWIISRNSRNVIITYTGNEKDRILAYHVQSLRDAVTSNAPNDEQIDYWPQEFAIYLFEQLKSDSCVATETKLGYAFITNLAQLDPFLTLINAKTGKISYDYKLYVVNQNLKSLGCGSRSALTVDEPSKSMEDKFKTQFQIHANVPINYAIVDLILVTQTFLYLYEVIDPVFCDGLFCTQTEVAIKEWWNIILNVPITNEIFKNKPPNCQISDSIQAVIGFTVLIRHILEMGGNNFGVPKDPMEVQHMKTSIGKFQKYHKLEKTCTLNLSTLLKLIEWGNSNKNTQSLTKDLSKMKNLVKNTVIDITSGKNLHSITQNASISPFNVQSRLYNNAPMDSDQRKMINCENIDHIKHMSMGKHLKFLYTGNGKPINIHKEALSMHIINHSARSNGSLEGSKKFKNKNPTSNPTSNPLSSLAAEGTENDATREDPEIRKKNLNSKEDSGLKKRSKYQDKLLPQLHLNSDDEDHHYGEFDDDMEVHHPKFDSLSTTYSNYHKDGNSRYDSIGAKSHTSYSGNEDIYPDYDGDYTNGHIAITDLIDNDDDIYYHAYPSQKSKFKHRTHEKDRELKSSPDPYNPLMEQSARLSSGFKTHSKSSSRRKLSSKGSSNENESDGVYEYENGFEYDYELDSDNPHQSQKGHSAPDSFHTKQPSLSKLSNEENLTRPYGAYSPSNPQQQKHNSGDSKSPESSLQRKLLLSQEVCCDNDADYCKFMKRVKRRHSIPLVEAEMNKYSIEFNLKKEEKDLERGPSYCGSKSNILERCNANGSSNEENKNDDASINNMRYMKRKQSIFGSQSLHTNSSLESGYVSFGSMIIYKNNKSESTMKRSLSFSMFEERSNSLINEGDLNFDISNVNFVTSEVLAMEYLKLKASYQNDTIQYLYNLKQQLQHDLKTVNDTWSSDQYNTTLLKYNSTSSDVSKAVGKYYELEDKLKNTVKSNARLKYELRLLLQKTKEVENNLKSFKDFKIDTLKTKMENMAMKMKICGQVDEKYRDVLCDENPSVNKCKMENSSPIVKKMFHGESLIQWHNIDWSYVVKRPYILLVFLFQICLCTVLRHVDSKNTQERWMNIDNNPTVVKILQLMYLTTQSGLRNYHGRDEKGQEPEEPK